MELGLRDEVAAITGASQPLWHEPIHNVTRGVPIIGLASAMP